jgi:hypothetical protein
VYAPFIFDVGNDNCTMCEIGGSDMHIYVTDTEWQALARAVVLVVASRRCEVRTPAMIEGCREATFVEIVLFV